ncbi:MAG: GyrI-like domain-containing protein, partial [Pseudomonadota bacterium]
MTITRGQRPGFTLIGYATRLKHTDVERINLHWQRFFLEGHVERIPQRLDSRIIALYCEYEGDQDGLFTLILGSAVPDGLAAPDGLERRVVPPQDYVQVTAVGELPGVIQQAW